LFLCDGFEVADERDFDDFPFEPPPLEDFFFELLRFDLVAAIYAVTSPKRPS
jgi:hypothetical protein